MYYMYMSTENKCKLNYNNYIYYGEYSNCT